MTPALSDALSKTHKVRDLQMTQHLPAYAAVTSLWLPYAPFVELQLQLSDGLPFCSLIKVTEVPQRPLCRAWKLSDWTCKL